jgi:hypothetical protein
MTSAVDPSGMLLVTSDANDAIVIGSTGGQVKVNGADPDTGPFPVAGVATIAIVATASAGPDANTFDLRAVTPSVFAALTGVSVDGGGGDDRLIGPDVPVTWGLTGPDTGILAGPGLGAIASFTFRSIENLAGGAGDDSFVVGAGSSLSGSIDGGGGFDTLDYGDVGAAVSVTLTGSDAAGFHGSATGIGAGFRGVDALIGGTGGDTLTGENTDSTWTLGGSPTYDDGNATLSFSRFETLQGGSGADTFHLIGDSLGDLAATIDGGAGDDLFLFEGKVVLTGSIDGQVGNDTLSYASYEIAVAVGLTGSQSTGYGGTEPISFSGGGFRGIGTLIGTPGDRGTDTLTGEDVPSTWTLDRVQSYEDISSIPPGQPRSRILARRSGGRGLAPRPDLLRLRNLAGRLRRGPLRDPDGHHGRPGGWCRRRYLLPGDRRRDLERADRRPGWTRWDRLRRLPSRDFHRPGLGCGAGHRGRHREYRECRGRCGRRHAHRRRPG